MKNMIPTNSGLIYIIIFSKYKWAFANNVMVLMAWGSMIEYDHSDSVLLITLHGIQHILYNFLSPFIVTSRELNLIPSKLASHSLRYLQTTTKLQS